MKPSVISFFALLLLITACLPFSANSAQGVITIYKSPAFALWYNKAEDCAIKNKLTLSPTNDPALADIALHYGSSPTGDQKPVYQIGSGSLSIVTNQKDAPPLSEGEVAKLFLSRTSETYQVWVFPGEDDIQRSFEDFFLDGQLVSPNTRLALTTEKMLQGLIGSEPSIGFLPTELVPPTMKTIFVIENIPLLAVSPQPPSGELALFTQCLQK